MAILSIILGIVLIIGGFCCMFTPVATFLSTGLFVCIMMFVYGIVGIVRFIKKDAGGLELLVSILGIIAGLIAIFRPGASLVFDSMVLNLVASWMLVQGVVSIVVSIQSRDQLKGWFWGVISGALGIIAGIYSFIHPGVTAVAVGVLIGLYFIESGINMIVLGVVLGDVRRAQ